MSWELGTKIKCFVISRLLTVGIFFCACASTPYIYKSLYTLIISMQAVNVTCTWHHPQKLQNQWNCNHFHICFRNKYTYIVSFCSSPIELFSLTSFHLVKETKIFFSSWFVEMKGKKSLVGKLGVIVSPIILYTIFKQGNENRWNVPVRKYNLGNSALNPLYYSIISYYYYLSCSFLFHTWTYLSKPYG